MTVSEKHHATAGVVFADFAAKFQDGHGDLRAAISIIAAALSAAEREGREDERKRITIFIAEQAAAMAEMSLHGFPEQSRIREAMEAAMTRIADIIRASAILSQANTHSPDYSSHQVNSPASTSSPEPGAPFQAKASEDNGATGKATMRRADCMAGEVSRADAGRTASATSEDGRDGVERHAPHHASRNGEGA